MTRYHTELATIARRTGFPVVEVAGWQTRGDGGMADRPTGIDVHHTASGRLTGDMPSLGILTHGRSDLRNSLCAYGLARSGRIYVVAAGESWHAGPVNDARFSNYQAFGIEAENDGVGERWPAVQVESYARLCAELCRHYGIPPSSVRGHKEVCYPAGRKIDPAGIDMAGFRSAVTARLQGEPSMSATEVTAIKAHIDVRTAEVQAAIANFFYACMNGTRADKVTPHGVGQRALLARLEALQASVAELAGADPNIPEDVEAFLAKIDEAADAAADRLRGELDELTLEVNVKTDPEPAQ